MLPARPPGQVRAATGATRQDRAGSRAGRRLLPAGLGAREDNQGKSTKPQGSAKPTSRSTYVGRSDGTDTTNSLLDSGNDNNNSSSNNSNENNSSSSSSSSSNNNNNNNANNNANNNKTSNKSTSGGNNNQAQAHTRSGGRGAPTGIDQHGPGKEQSKALVVRYDNDIGDKREFDEEDCDDQLALVKLTPGEIKAAFDFLDVDKKGVVSLQAIKKRLVSLFGGPELVPMADLKYLLGNKKTLTFKDLRKLVDETVEVLHSSQIDPVEIAFGLFDQTGQGYVDPSALAGTMERLGYGTLTEEESTILMEMLDDDGDGRFGLEDFATLLDAERLRMASALSTEPASPASGT